MNESSAMKLYDTEYSTARPTGRYSSLKVFCHAEAAERSFGPETEHLADEGKTDIVPAGMYPCASEMMFKTEHVGPDDIACQVGFGDPVSPFAAYPGQPRDGAIAVGWGGGACGSDTLEKVLERPIRTGYVGCVHRPFESARRSLERAGDSLDEMYLKIDRAAFQALEHHVQDENHVTDTDNMSRQCRDMVRKMIDGSCGGVGSVNRFVWNKDPKLVVVISSTGNQALLEREIADILADELAPGEWAHVLTQENPHCLTQDATERVIVLSTPEMFGRMHVLSGGTEFVDVVDGAATVYHQSVLGATFFNNAYGIIGPTGVFGQ